MRVVDVLWEITGSTEFTRVKAGLEKKKWVVCDNNYENV